MKPTWHRQYIVRWRSGRRGDIKHRFYSRRFDAARFAARLDSYGIDSETFSSPVEWAPILRGTLK